MKLSFKNWKLKSKLLVVCLLLSVIPLIALGIFSYVLAERAVYAQIEDKLKMQARVYSDMLDKDMGKIDDEIEAAKADARTIVQQQAEILIRLFRLGGDANVTDLKDTLASLKVGKTGYVFVLDYDGMYVVSQKRQRDGENIWTATDASGNLFIQEIIRKGRSLSAEGIDFQVYPWKNTGETVVREKIAGIIHLPRLDWVIGVSAYFDDLVDVNLKDKETKLFKEKLLSEKVGAKGYMYVMDGEGNLVMHPDKEGQSLAGESFAQEIIRKKTERGFLRYSWVDGEKVAAYSYYEPLDWIIVTGSYLSDFTGELKSIQLVIIVTMIVSISLVVLISLLFAGWIYKSLNRTAGSLSSSSMQISSAAVQLSSSSQEIAGGASEQASSIEETTSSMEELASMVRQNLQNAKEAASLADRAAGSSKEGFGQMDKMLESMKEINKSSDQISKVIKIIDDIAFQTNILALNAAVEAARAGEAGMGFAVVADEVKNLANKSAAAAKETSGMIEASIKKTEEGLAIAMRLAEVFKDILNNSQKVSEMSKEVESASTQQDTGINQVNKAIVQFDEVVQANASAAEETASSAEELQTQVDALNNMVGELLILVNGSNDDHAATQSVPAARIEHKPSASAALKRPPMKKKASSLSVPEKLIPFEEDEEFRDADKT